jgi:hypothetical protein
MRTHLFLSLTAADTDTNPGVTWGTIMQDKSVVAAARPDPNVDTGADWVMLRLLGPGTSPSSIAAPPNAPTEYLYGNEYDIRARRRIHEMQDSYFFCLHNTGSASLNYTVFVRTLVALA